MAHVSEDAPVAPADILAVMGMYYIALLVTAILLAAFAGEIPADLVPALDQPYASNFTA